MLVLTIMLHKHTLCPVLRPVTTPVFSFFVCVGESLTHLLSKTVV